MKRTESIWIRMTVQELARLESLAKKHKMNRVRLIRKAIAEYPFQEEIFKYVLALGKRIEEKKENN